LNKIQDEAILRDWSKTSVGKTKESLLLLRDCGGFEKIVGAFGSPWEFLKYYEKI